MLIRISFIARALIYQEENLSDPLYSLQPPAADSSNLTAEKMSSPLGRLLSMRESIGIDWLYLLRVQTPTEEVLQLLWLGLSRRR